MTARHIVIVYRKEMLDILRDRRTLMSMILVPLVLMPVLIFGLAVASVKILQRAQRDGATVMLLGAEHAPALAAKIREMKEFQVVSPAEDYVRLIEEKKLRAAVEFPLHFEERMSRGEVSDDLTIYLYYYRGELLSTLTVRSLRESLVDYRDHVVEQRLAARQLSADILKPFETKQENVASPQKVSGAIMGGLIPYLLILLSLTGAMYPAIDLTAGEKERGTMETILASAVSRGALAMGKFLAVLTVSLATVLLSLFSLAATLKLVPSVSAIQPVRGQISLFQFSLGVKNFLLVLALVLPLAILFSAVLLSIALLAKSFKEAQSYVSPVLIVVILTAIVSTLPGIELNAKLALVPIVNVSLASKEIFTDTYHWPYLALIFFSSCLYAAGALGVAAAVFKREWVLFRT